MTNNENDVVIPKDRTLKRKQQKRRQIYSIDEQGRIHLYFHPGQWRAWTSKARFIYVIAGSQGGKALWIYTPIPVPGGYKLLKDIQVGDIVFDAYGNQTEVIGVTDVMYDHQVYSMRFSTGEVLLADADHLWVVGWVGTHTKEDWAERLEKRPIRTETLYKRFKEGRRFFVVQPAKVESFYNYYEPQIVYIENITPVPSVPVKCISVASPTHVYLAGRTLIPTHNTSFGPWWLYREFQTALDKGIPTPIDLIAITSTYSLFRNKMLPELRKVFERVLGIGHFSARDNIIYLGSPDDKTQALGRIIMVSATNPQAIEAATAYAAWGDEVGQDSFTEEAYRALERRLTTFQGRALFTTTPYNFGWLFKRYMEWKDYQERGEQHPYMDFITFASTENPAFPKEEFERLQQELPSWYFDMFYRGLFTKPPNLVYPEFSLEEHVFDRSTWMPDPSWSIYLGIDFGGRNTVVLIGVYDEDNEILYIADSLHLPNMPTEEQVRQTLAVLQEYPNELVAAWGGTSGETQARYDWAESGIPVDGPPFKEIMPGINRVSMFLRTGRLKVASHLETMIREFRTYSYELDETGVINYLSIKSKSTYHHMDALRYLISGLSTHAVQAAFLFEPDPEELLWEDAPIIAA